MQIPRPGDVVTFTEYEVMPMSGARHILQRMENMTVHAVVLPGEILCQEQIEEYYGDELDYETLQVLSVSQATRLILKDDEEHLYSVNVAESFLKSGLQTLEAGVKAAPKMPETPSYLQFMNMFGGAADE